MTAICCICDQGCNPEGICEQCAYCMYGCPAPWGETCCLDEGDAA